MSHRSQSQLKLRLVQGNLAAPVAPEQPTSEPLVPATRSSNEPNISILEESCKQLAHSVPTSVKASGDVPQSIVGDARLSPKQKLLQNHQRSIKGISSHGDSLAPNMGRCIREFGKSMVDAAKDNASEADDSLLRGGWDNLLEFGTKSTMEVKVKACDFMIRRERSEKSGLTMGEAESAEAVADPQTRTSLGSLLSEAADYGTQHAQSIEAMAQKALECPCVADLRTGPCGSQFSEAFLCFLKSTSLEKGSDCVHPFVALQSCIKANPNAFSKDILGEDETKESEPIQEYKIFPPKWSKESRSPKSRL
ncbi:hypothetical protein VNO78_24902 [Psophocarpus tetragonolobus]|uniref:Mitochondrial intermembrane space import and assembly protein 40 homolog n=1 Tax=Psophocarpus tetragonolobus TaxID=3891 RepID=A0AAN9XEW8_PSOTE